MIVLGGLALIVPVWFLCVVTGLGFMIFSKRRRLAATLIIGATLGAFGAETLSLAVFIILGPGLGVHGPEQSAQNILIYGYFAGFVAGGVLGTKAGIALVPMFNRPLARKPKHPSI